MAFLLSDDDMQAISGLNLNLSSNVLNEPETFPWQISSLHQPETS
jgi:hypothetical protein